MFKVIALFVIIAIANVFAVPAITTPLLARVEPQPKAPASTEHATHVAAKIPVAEYVPIRYTSVISPYLSYPEFFDGYGHGGYRVVY